jgi:osmotically-inducible protein OsmY
MRRGVRVAVLALAMAGCNDPRLAEPELNGARGSESAPDDAALIREIRRKIMASTTFSADAQKVEVVSEDGVVTLRGPVENEQEKAALVAIAREAPGVARVDDQLEIASR